MRSIFNTSKVLAVVAGLALATGAAAAVEFRTIGSARDADDLRRTLDSPRVENARLSGTVTSTYSERRDSHDLADSAKSQRTDPFQGRLRLGSVVRTASEGEKLDAGKDYKSARQTKTLQDLRPATSRFGSAFSRR